MGRWPNKNAVEDYYSLSTKFLKKHGYLKSSSFLNGLVSWKRPYGENIARVDIAVSTYPNHGEIRFQYTSTDRSSGEKTERDYSVALHKTSCNYGGVRWWFICPLSKNGIPCQRRVGVLYLVSTYFGCRHCFELNYQSSKDSHKFDRMFRKLGLDPRFGMKKLAEDLF